MNGAGAVANFYAANNNSASFKFNPKTTAKTNAGGTENTKILV